MIIIRYRGGLGNQMFQYAFGIALQKCYKDVPVLADLTHYRMNQEHNGFELERVFRFEMSKASQNMIRKLSPYLVPSDLFDKLPERMKTVIATNLQFKYYEKKKGKKRYYYRQEYHSLYDPELFKLDCQQDWYLDGLWQDLRYFKNCEDQIRKAFTFQNEENYTDLDRKLIEEIQSCNSVGIHIRRGDFVNSKFDICSSEYYRKAITLIQEKMQKPCFFFFSDDPQFVAEQFADMENMRIVRHDSQSSILDMEMLSLCRHVIISNSTFAFWGAWLGEGKDKIVIAPRYSLINHGRKFELRLPDGWIQLEE